MFYFIDKRLVKIIGKGVGVWYLLEFSDKRDGNRMRKGRRKAVSDYDDCRITSKELANTLCVMNLQ